MLFEEDRCIDQDVRVLEGIDYLSTRAGCSKRRSAASPVDATEEDKLSKSIEAILARILIDEQSRLTNSA